MCNAYDIENYRVARQPPDHAAQTRSHGTNQVTQDKSGTKRDLQAPHGGPRNGSNVRIWLTPPTPPKVADVINERPL